MSSAAAKSAPANGNAPVKDLYEVGEVPPLGHVPAKMYAWCIRQERHGAPDSAMQVEVVPTWEIGEDECLVLVLAAGGNLRSVVSFLIFAIAAYATIRGVLAPARATLSSVGTVALGKYQVLPVAVGAVFVALTVWPTSAFRTVMTPSIGA